MRELAGWAMTRGSFQPEIFRAALPSTCDRVFSPIRPFFSKPILPTAVTMFDNSTLLFKDARAKGTAGDHDGNIHSRKPRRCRSLLHRGAGPEGIPCRFIRSSARKKFDHLKE
jgi:hypothetical protein